MAQCESWFKQDLKKPIKVQMLNGNLFSQDNQGNLIGVEVFDNGEPVSLSGTVSANIIRADGGTVSATGTLSGNKCSVVLPAAAYAVPGLATIVIKLTSSGVVTTLLALVVTIYRASTDTAVDPGTVMPSIQSLIQQINTAVASIPADYSSLWTSLAPAFSTDASYVAGQYVKNNGKVYRFNTAHTGEWTAGDVNEVKLGNELTDLNRALNTYCDTNIFQSATFQQGYYVSVSTLSTTTINVYNTRICAQVALTEALPFNILIKILNNSYNYECGLFDENGNSLSYKSGWQTEDWNYTASRKIKYIRINIRKSDNGTITAYSNEIGGFLDSFVSLADSYKVSMQIDGIKDLINFSENITWNQLASVFTRSSGTLVGGVAYTKSADSKTASFNGTATSSDFYQLINSGIGNTVSGHKYAFITPNAKGNINTEKCFFYYVNRDTKDYGDGVIFTASSSASIIYGIEIGSGASFDNLTIDVPIMADLTEMFGTGNEPTIKQFRAMFPNGSYPHDSGTQRKLTRMELNALNILKNEQTIDSFQNNFTKLRIMTHNCGHFNYGSSSEYSGDDMQEKITEWKAMIARNKPDILLAQECSQYFDAGQTVNAYNTLYKPLLPYMFYQSYTRVISKCDFARTWQLDLTVTVDGQTESRSNGCAEISVCGKTIGICSAHLSPGYDSHANAVREAQRNIIINAFANYDYVIIGGDFNAQADSFYTAFTDAGYSLANHGYFGNINTYPSEPIDNIIVKGILLYDAVSKAEDKCTSDHQPLVSEILLN